VLFGTLLDLISIDGLLPPLSIYYTYGIDGTLGAITAEFFLLNMTLLIFAPCGASEATTEGPLTRAGETSPSAFSSWINASLF